MKFRLSGFILMIGLAFGGAMVGRAQGMEELPKLRPIRTEIPPTYWEREGRALVLHVTEFVAWLGFTGWLLLRPYPKPAEPIEVVVRRELEQLRAHPDAGRMLSEVARAVRKYFVAGFDLPRGEHTTTEFCRLVTGSERVGLALAERTEDFLRRCDAARFAPTGGFVPTAVAEAMQLVEAGEARRQELRQAERAPTASPQP